MKIQPADAELAEALWSNLSAAPSREIQCRHCGQPNEVPLPAALFDTTSCECATCSRSSVMNLVIFRRNTSPTVCSHPCSRRAYQPHQASQDLVSSLLGH